MGEYRIGFEVVCPEGLEAAASRFYESLDGLLLERAGKVTAFVYVSGRSGSGAAYEAIEDLERTGLSVVRTDADLVDGPEIGVRLDVSRQAVQSWAKGTRGSGFPHPVGTVGSKRIWAWAQIVEWLRQIKPDFDEPAGLSQDEAATVDAMLARRRAHAAPVGSRIDWAIDHGTTKTQAGRSGVNDYESKRLLQANEATTV